MTDKIKAGTYQRTILELDRKAASEDARTVPAALSSETEVERYFGREVLVHEADAIDLSRADGIGLPLLWNHSTDAPIGKIENLALGADRVLRGLLRFSKNAKASEVWNDIRDGFLGSVSIGYRVDRWEETKDSDIVKITRWTLLEGSIVPIPADASVGINRSLGASTMADNTGQTTEQPGGGQTVAPVDITAFRSQFEAGKKSAETEIRQKQAERMLEIEDIFALPNIPQDEFYRSLKRDAIAKNWTPDQVRTLILQAMAGDMPSAPPAAPTPDMRSASDTRQGINRPRVQAGEDQRDKFSSIVADALLVRAGMCDDKEAVARVDASGYRNRSLLRLAEEYLRHANVDTRTMDDKGIARAVLSRSAGPQTASDFTSILANVANKSTLRGWETAGTSYQMWCNIGSLPDFKQATIARLGAYPDIDKIPTSGGPYQLKGMDDIHEVTTLETYGALFGISRHAIINDDLNEFTRIPQAMGSAAARKVNQLAYNELITSDGSTASVTGRVLTQDSVALFNAASHSNYVASGSGAAPSVATLNTAEAAMMRQKAPLIAASSASLAYINVQPGFLIVPPELKATAQILVTSTYDPAGTTASVSRRDSPNPWQGRLEVVADPVLTLATGWYLAAPRAGNVDSVTVFFLNGQSAPYIEQQDNWTSDGVTFKVRIDAVARALDFRGLYFNYGA